MQTMKRSFLPAAGFALALPLYDPLTRLLGGDTARVKLLDAAGLQAGQRVLDIGCGTGTLLVEAARRTTDVELIGIDPDPAALRLARRKAQRARLAIRFEEAFADALPFADASFDCVLSSFMLHHLDAPTQLRALREVARVLKPAGRLHLMDFAHAHHGGHGALQQLVHRLHGGRFARVHVAADLPAALQQAGFAEVQVSEQPRAFHQRVLCYAATRAAVA